MNNIIVKKTIAYNTVLEKDIFENTLSKVILGTKLKSTSANQPILSEVFPNNT